MAIRLEFAPGRVTAYLEGEIDHHNAAALRECIDEAVEKHRPETLRIDFGGVSFMDSSGVGLVIGRTSVMQALGGKVEVVNLTPQAISDAACKAGSACSDSPKAKGRLRG